MTYDYECCKCGHVQEEWHGMSERPRIHCNKCRGACVKLIGSGAAIMGMAAGRGLYDFVDFNTTGKPVRIHTKRQWQQHLQNHGLNDDIQNTPFKRDQLKEGMLNVDKAKMRRELKDTIVKAVKDKKHIKKLKEKVKGGR